MYTIDRFEGEYAICEDENRNMHQLKRCDIPMEAKEGDCICIVDGQFMIDEKETKKRKERVSKLLSSLFED